MDNIGTLAAYMSPLSVGGIASSSSTVNTPNNQQKELEYVFVWRHAFHGINQNGSKRHSLMTILRRNSLNGAVAVVSELCSYS